MPPPYLIRPPRIGDYGWIVSRHAELYWQEYKWGEPFEGLCAQIVADFATNYDATRERCWIAEMNGENVGCVMLVKENGTSARACACCSWIRKRAEWDWARGWSTSACVLRGRPATNRLRYGRTAYFPAHATFMRRRAFA